MRPSLPLTVLASLLALPLAACGSSQESTPPGTSRGGSSATPSSAAPAAPDPAPQRAAPLRELHGFAMHPSFHPVCQQSVLGAPGSGSLSWSLEASELELSTLAAWYRQRLPAVRPREEAGSVTFHLPDAEHPEHVLQLYAVGRPSMPSCGASPPAGARTLANVSTMTRPSTP